MWNNFFNHVDVKKENVNILNGNAEDLEAECQRYEDKIKSYGGIHLFMGGIGPDGHIAFNEPDEKLVAGTHLTSLTESTINANARFFEKKEDVPTQAVTMGMASIMQAKKVLLIADGPAKKEAIEKSFFGPICPEVPASVLQLHPDLTVICNVD